MKEKQRNALTSTYAEKLMYSVGDAAGAMILCFPGAYLTLYYTDCLGINAAFIGTLMVICRLLDGISDVTMGIIVDRTHTKWGKARPWFAISIIPLLITFIALFNTPKSLSGKSLIVYVYVVYILMTVVFYTMNNIAYHAMLQRFSLTSADRGSVSAIRAFLCILFADGMTIIIPLVMPGLGGEGSQNTWTILAVIVGIIAFICLMVTALGIKEKIPAVKKDDENGNKMSKEEMKSALKGLLKSKYFYLVAGITLIWFASFNMMGINFYYARDVLGSASLTSVIAIMITISGLISMPFVPALYNRFGKKNTVIAGLIISALASIAIMIDPENQMLNWVCILIRGMATSPLSAAVATLAGDVTDYNQMKTGLRTEGLTTSVYSVGVKIGTGLGGACVAWGLAIGGYSAKATVQSASAINSMIITFSVIPAVLYVIGIVLMMFWDLEKHQPQVQKFIEQQNI